MFKLCNNQQAYIGSKLIMEEIPLVQLIYTGKTLNNDLVNIVTTDPFLKVDTNDLIDVGSTIAYVLKLVVHLN